MESSAKVNVSDIIDQNPFGAYQVGLGVLVGVCLMIAGFDVQAMGYVAPALVRDWGIANSVLGPVFSAALAGVLVGSLLLSMLADKIGRRPVLVGAALFFGVMTLWTARANSVTELLVVRFLAGIGLGAVVPNTTALIGEYSPARMRVPIMMIVGNSFNIGAAFGGFIAAWLIPAFGWRAVFYFGGAVPLALAVLMIVLLPESLQFLVLQGKKLHQVTKTLKRIAPAASVSNATEYVVREEKKQGIPFVNLFHEGRAAVTTLLWTVFFLNLLNLYLLASWLPTLVSQLGYSTANAVLVGTTLQVGAVTGSFVNAAFVRRLGITTLLTAGFTIGCLSVALIGQVGFSLSLLFVVVFLAGWGVPGSQGMLNTFAATYYPTYLRSTGVGWCLGIGRTGAIVGPLFAGELMRRQWQNQQLFLAAASLALIAAVVIFFLRFLIKPQKTLAAATSAASH